MRTRKNISSDDIFVDAKEAVLEVNGKSPTSLQKFITKLNDGRYEEFDHKDWLHYWSHKRQLKGMGRYIPNPVMDTSVLKSVMQKFSGRQIKMMIDFLFDCDHDLANKFTMNIGMLKKSWLNTVYNSALLWKNGEYIKPKESKESKDTRNREWVSDSGSSMDKSLDNRNKVASPKKSKIRI